MKYILIGAIVLLVIADFVFWGGPSQLADHWHDTFGNGPAAGTVRSAGSIGGMINGAGQGVANSFKNGAGQ